MSRDKTRIRFQDYNDNIREMSIADYYDYCHNLSNRVISSGDKGLILYAIRSFERIRIGYKHFYLRNNLSVDNEIKSLLRVLPKEVIPTSYIRNGGTIESWKSLPGFKGYSKLVLEEMYKHI